MVAKLGRSMHQVRQLQHNRPLTTYRARSSIHRTCKSLRRTRVRGPTTTSTRPRRSIWRRRRKGRHQTNKATEAMHHNPFACTRDFKLLRIKSRFTKEHSRSFRAFHRMRLMQAIPSAITPSASSNTQTNEDSSRKTRGNSPRKKGNSCSSTA